MHFNIPTNLEKIAVFEQIAEALKKENFTVIKQDTTRPWGGFFVIDESQANAFASKFFPQLEMSQIQITNKLSPKILVVVPNKRLSWQFHHRRAEIWKVIGGTVGVKTSNTDQEGEIQQLSPGNFYPIGKGRTSSFNWP
ncbi:phosphoheptose isomerase [Flavobacterium sp.]|uniref:phosphoheptose isomerase n=1 Tax=Flavobacterium sp. TaxID=239 RepID=UPI003750264D